MKQTARPFVSCHMLHMLLFGMSESVHRALGFWGVPGEGGGGLGTSPEAGQLLGGSWLQDVMQMSDESMKARLKWAMACHQHPSCPMRESQKMRGWLNLYEPPAKQCAWCSCPDKAFELKELPPHTTQ